ncbi:MAG TPA: hypothetical protein VFL91_34140 [Thermomicrobiales bacterium]|nr:hypothetical protein [Thermomicrobiales bacterium]
MITPHTRDSTATTAAEEPIPHDAESAGAAPPQYAAELAALRARLREVEALLGLPLRPGQRVPPDVTALRRRVAALERRAGVVPGLVPLPGCDAAATPARATTITSESVGREPAWRERGRAALAAVALLAALAWLLHPLPVGPGYSPAARATARPAEDAPGATQALVAVPAGAPATTAAPAEEQPARADYRAQHAELSPVAPGAPQAPAAAPAQPGVPPCLTGDSAGCASPAPGAAAAGRYDPSRDR